MTPDSIRLAVAQPRFVGGDDAERNVDVAEALVARAAADGAELVLFPEGCPGPTLRQPLDTYDPSDRMASAAARHGVVVVWSRMERCADDRFRLVVYAVERDGTTVLRYERAHPATIPPADEGHGVWTAPGPELCPVVELAGVPMAVVVCSELWVPESSRVHAVRGAEVLLSPAGGGFTSLTENWKVMVRARAIENLCHVAMTNNVWSNEVGAATIAGPERVVITSGTEDLLVATLDLARARWLRDHDDSIVEPKGFDSIPGLVRARRPELYGDLSTPAPDTYAFFEDPTPSAGAVDGVADDTTAPVG
jgi:predicted amidohydrolase